MFGSALDFHVGVNGSSAFLKKGSRPAHQHPGNLVLADLHPITGLMDRIDLAAR